MASASSCTPLRLAVFDCDGTLVDSQASIVVSMAEAFSAAGFDAPDPGAVRRVVGLPLTEAIEQLLPEADLCDWLRLTEGYKTAFSGLRRAGIVHEPLFPGAIEALDALEEAGWILGVATGKSHVGLVSTLERHGLLDRFVTLQTADSARGKPHPEMLFNAMAQAGVNRASTVMIGDTTFDMLMASNAGTTGVGVSWGYHEPEELKATGAEALVDRYDDLPQAMKILMERV